MAFTDLPSLSAALLLMPFLVGATLTDLDNRHIPNYLVAAMLGFGVLVQAVSLSMLAVAWSLAGAAVGFAILLPMYVLGGTGAGDVKLLAGVGSFLGPVATLYAGLATLIAGGVIAVLWVGGLKVRACVGGTARAAGESQARSKTYFPYSLAIMAGTLISVTLW